MNPLFPIFVKPDLITYLVIGGGRVALEKIKAITSHSPASKILVLAPNIDPEIILLKNSFSIEILQKDVHEADLARGTLIIAATNIHDVNMKIYHWAKQQDKIINVVDTPDYCDFYFGSVVTKGDLKIAISTNGKSPTFAKRFKEMLQESLPDSIPEILENLNQIRNTIQGDFQEKLKQLNEITKILKSK